MARTSKKHNVYQNGAGKAVKESVNDQICRTALYARLSVEDNGKDGDSLESQLMYLRSYIADKPEFQLCGEFTDNGFTGTNYHRPGFQEMIRQVREGRIDCIVIKDLSRLGRNYIDTGDFIEKICPMLGLRLIAVNDRFDTAGLTSAAEMSASVMNIANDMYAKDISRKACSALQGKMERGEYIGNYAPYGYLKDPENKNHLIPDPATAPVVVRIYQMRAEGMGIGRIARVLNKEDISSPGRYRFENGIITNNNKKGKNLLWNRHVLSDILKNVAYIGNLAQARGRSALYRGIPFHLTKPDDWVVARGTHEGIISQELFRKVQDVNEQRSAANKANSGKYDYLPRAVNLYGKKLVCADCEAVIKLVRSISTKKDKAYFTFKCPVYIEHGEQGCTDKKIPQAELDQAVLATIQAHIRLFGECKEILEKMQKKAGQKNSRGPYQKILHEMEQKVKQKHTLRAGLYMDFKEGILTEEEYLYSKKRFTEEIERMEREMESVRAKAEEAACSMDQFQNWTGLIEKYKDIQELSRETVEAFVQKVILHDNRKVEIHLNYMDEFRAARDFCKKQGEGAA